MAGSVHACYLFSLFLAIYSSSILVTAAPRSRADPKEVSLADIRWAWIRRNVGVNIGDSVLLVDATRRKSPIDPTAIRNSCIEACGQWLDGGRWRNTSMEGRGNEEEGCRCECPSDAPTLLFNRTTTGRPHAAKCGGKAEDTNASCRSPILFKRASGGKDRTQLISLPTLGSLDYVMLGGKPIPITRNSGVAIAWKEASVKTKHLVQSRCRITRVLYLDLTDQNYDATITANTSNGEWIEVKSQRWFQLDGRSSDDATVAWNTTEIASGSRQLRELKALLEGSILKLTLECSNRAQRSKRSSSTTVTPPRELCLAFKVAGQLNNTHPRTSLPSSPTPGSEGTEGVEGGGRRLESILIILLIILLVMSVTGSALMWGVCWRVKKRELIGRLQMQFLFHIKQEREKIASDMAQRYSSPQQRVPNGDESSRGGGGGRAGSATGPAYYRGQQGHDSGVDSQPQAQGGTQGFAFGDLHSPASRTLGYNASSTPASSGAMMNGGSGGGVGAKRKLYFSPEFFEPHLMSNPPPMAEQFLHDLRRMIAIAKHRILLRRYVSRLGIIPEETEEDIANLAGLGRCVAQAEAAVAAAVAQQSPPSANSTDDGIGGEEEEGEDAEQGESAAPTREEPVPLKNREGSSSRIPISKSPRLISKAAAAGLRPLSLHPLSSSSSHDSDADGLAVVRRSAQPPPLPPPRYAPPPPPPPNVPPPPVPSSVPPTPPYLAAAAARAAATAKRQAEYGYSLSQPNNSYPVFPSASTEQMLKKSLPRRSKKRAIPKPDGAISNSDSSSTYSPPNGTMAKKSGKALLLETNM